MPDDLKKSDDPQTAGPLAIFAFFNEIGILAQLSRAMFEARLPDGLSVAHFAVLNHLIRVGDGPTPLKLAQAFQVPKTSMTNTLAGLERRGLIETRPNPRDGRSKQVWLTDAGRTFRDQAQLLLVPDIQALAGQLDIDRMVDMLPDLSEVRSHLDAYRDP